MNYIKLSSNPYFIYCSFSENLTEAIMFRSPPTYLFLNQLIFVYTSTILWSHFSYKKQLSNFVLILINLECHAICSDSSSILFACFILLISIIPSHKSKKTISFRIIIVKMIIIQINIIKILLLRYTSLLKNKNVTTSSFLSFQFSSYSIISIVTNQSGAKFNTSKQLWTALSYIS